MLAPCCWNGTVADIRGESLPKVFPAAGSGAAKGSAATNRLCVERWPPNPQEASHALCFSRCSGRSAVKTMRQPSFSMPRSRRVTLPGVRQQRTTQRWQASSGLRRASTSATRCRCGQGARALGRCRRSILQANGRPPTDPYSDLRPKRRGTHPFVTKSGSETTGYPPIGYQICVPNDGVPAYSLPKVVAR